MAEQHLRLAAVVAEIVISVELWVNGFVQLDALCLQVFF
jgi:hypothetical protein